MPAHMSAPLPDLVNEGEAEARMHTIFLRALDDIGVVGTDGAGGKVESRSKSVQEQRW